MKSNKPKLSGIIEKLKENDELGGYTSPTGRVTYNQVITKKSFGIFSDIIESIVPIDIINSDKSDRLPSIAKTIKGCYPKYFYINATMDEYMDYETEEDQENMTELLSIVKDEPVYGICIQKNLYMKSAHACAFIIWKNKTKYKFAFYDPLSHTKKKQTFDYAERAFVSIRFNEKIEFINLNIYCFHKTPEQFHCSQYVMNAEYCYIYSLYFLKKWLEFGAKKHRATFRKTIKSTYIVKPESLTRANNKDSMIYRVVMMEFVCKTLVTYLRSLNKSHKKMILNSDENIKRILEYVEYIKKEYDLYFVL